MCRICRPRPSVRMGSAGRTDARVSARKSGENIERSIRPEVHKNLCARLPSRSNELWKRLLPDQVSTNVQREAEVLPASLELHVR